PSRLQTSKSRRHRDTVISSPEYGPRGASARLLLGEGRGLDPRDALRATLPRLDRHLALGVRAELEGPAAGRQPRGRARAARPSRPRPQLRSRARAGLRAAGEAAALLRLRPGPSRRDRRRAGADL